MNRYLIFAGSEFYPGKGFRDFKMACREWRQVAAIIPKVIDGEDWVQVVDLKTMACATTDLHEGQGSRVSTAKSIEKIVKELVSELS